MLPPVLPERAFAPRRDVNIHDLQKDDAMPEHFTVEKSPIHENIVPRLHEAAEKPGDEVAGD